MSSGSWTDWSTLTPWKTWTWNSSSIRLGIHNSALSSFISFGIYTVDKFNSPITLSRNGHPSMSFRVLLIDTVPQGAAKESCVNLIPLTPREHVVDFAGGFSIRATKDPAVTMPNRRPVPHGFGGFRYLRPVGSTLPRDGFPIPAKPVPGLFHPVRRG